MNEKIEQASAGVASVLNAELDCVFDVDKKTVETDSLEYRRERLLIYALYVEGITKNF